jgi:hypothetical protein
LGSFAVQGAEHEHLLLRLHALGDGREAEGTSEVDDRRHDDAVMAVADDPGREVPVDLDDIDGELLQVRERRVSRTEVVDGDPHTDRLERLERGPAGAGVVHEHVLGDLEAEVARRQS